MKLSHKYKTKKNKKKKFKMNGGDTRKFSKFKALHDDINDNPTNKRRLLTRQNDINHYETTQASEREPVLAQAPLITKHKDKSQTLKSSINKRPRRTRKSPNTYNPAHESARRQLAETTRVRAQISPAPAQVPAQISPAPAQVPAQISQQTQPAQISQQIASQTTPLPASNLANSSIKNSTRGGETQWTINEIYGCCKNLYLNDISVLQKAKTYDDIIRVMAAYRYNKDTPKDYMYEVVVTNGTEEREDTISESILLNGLIIKSNRNKKETIYDEQTNTVFLRDVENKKQMKTIIDTQYLPVNPKLYQQWWSKKIFYDLPNDQ